MSAVKLTGGNNNLNGNNKHIETMNEHPRYDWSYAVAFSLLDYPMLILADWITAGWHNIHWGVTAIEAVIISVLLTLTMHLIQKFGKKDKKTS